MKASKANGPKRVMIGVGKMGKKDVSHYKSAMKIRP